MAADYALPSRAASARTEAFARCGEMAELTIRPMQAPITTNVMGVSFGHSVARRQEAGNGC